MDVKPELVENARAGGASLDRLIEIVWPEAYRIALSVLHDRPLAEDVAQDACVAMARSLPTLKDAGHFAAWSYKIIVRAAIATARRRPRTHLLDEVADRGETFDPSDGLDLSDAMAALPVLQRAVVLLHYYAGLKNVDIATATGLPASTVRFHLMLARRALRKALSSREASKQSPSKEINSHA